MLFYIRAIAKLETSTRSLSARNCKRPVICKSIRTPLIITQDAVSLSDTTVAQLVGEIEKSENFKFCSRRMNVYEAADIFNQTAHDGWYLDGILITDNGKNGESLLGIIVLEDIATYLPDLI